MGVIPGKSGGIVANLRGGRVAISACGLGRAHATLLLLGGWHRRIVRPQSINGISIDGRTKILPLG